MRRFFLIAACAIFSLAALAAETVSSPDGKTKVTVDINNGSPVYSVAYDGVTVIMPSPLGLKTNVGDFTGGLVIKKAATGKVTDDYELYNIKRQKNHYEANSLTVTLAKDNADVLDVIFQVSDNNVAFRYRLLPQKDTKCCVINSEATAFRLTDGTTTFLCPQMGFMTGFARTAPSYETHYDADQPMGRNGWGQGYTFPCLFRSPLADGKGNNWVLISETGIDGNYCASRLDGKDGGLYQLTFPSEKENNGYGSATVQAALPSLTPWRTITVGPSLQPIVETTVTWDVLGDNKEYDYPMAIRDNAKERYGRGSWSWIIGGDNSCTYDVQRKYIDFSAAMGWESLLIDALWDTKIGRDRIAELAKYGREKGVNLYLWYNSNGQWNDAPQSPRNRMDRSHARRAEMAWMKSIGIRGIKVDFFGGDKQCTMQLYEDILRDAQEFGILVIFHGCTLPRGWERMYPAFVSAEAVRASENMNFSQGECDREAYSATFLPFIRNTVGSMDFGGSTLNKHYNLSNNRGSRRVTSDVFALATAVLFQSPVQHFAMTPGNLTDAPQWALDFMKTVPTQWEDLRFIDGYPGRYVILARKSAGKWYITGINGQKEPLKVTVPMDLFEAGQQVTLYSDDSDLNGSVKQIKVSRRRELKVTIPVNGAFLVSE